ncbi:TraR/DksA C4-type zinc finger protein [Paenibacillus faecalis]|uniref:TraR/DksA C4-type zinc finger protein n=1 Tax=Paenibacillus faecalis TaxID=2079532 RepID=UPI000D1075CD|nr:TraR/DksA C4-type zinc finger protein [Paenibacillus faecalis]
MKHLSDRQLQTLKRSLITEKKQLEPYDEEKPQLSDSLSDSTGEISTADNHPADIGTETFERGRDIAINETLSDVLIQIRDSLQRMEDGTYGICDTCGTEIPYERLAALPYTIYCIEHAPDRQLTDERSDQGEYYNTLTKQPTADKWPFS